VVLNAERKGESAFTVTNITGRALRGRGVLKPLGQTAPGWLSIAGEAERDFAIGAVQQYAVPIAVPMDVAPGDYTFRLDAVGVNNPDENFTQGPVITFTVSLPPPPPPPPSKPFPWWIVAVVVGVLIVIGIVIFLLTRPGTGNFAGTWQSNFALLNLAQDGTAINGTVQVYGSPTAFPVTGTVNGKMLNGAIVFGTSGLPFTLTLSSNDSGFDGTLQEFTIIPWCGVRSGPLPDGCGFAGRWNLAGDGFTTGAFAQVQQTGPSVSGSFSSGMSNGQLTGLVSGIGVEGQFTRPGGGTGTFAWRLVIANGRDDQFVGNGDGLAWCGFRDGLTAPTPCLSSLIPETPEAPSLLP
jgi:hypothetical protein